MPDDLKPDTSLGEEALADKQQSAESGAAVGVAEPSPAPFAPTVNAGDAAEGDAEAAMLAMLAEEENKGAQAKNRDDEAFPDLSGVRLEQPSASPVEFQQLSLQAPSSPTRSSIDLLLDVKMPIAIELGRTEMAISEILNLGPGSVVELNKLAGEPVDLLVNGRVIARGEVVVVDENFGVRITLLMSPQERLKSLAQE
jgi:flagellar motor switch protein FliN/FliY